MTPSSSIAAIAFASILAATASAPASPAIDRDDTAGPDTRRVAIDGSSLGGFVLPILPVQHDLEMDAKRATNWTADDTQRLLLEGDVEITLGTYAFRADLALVWINRLPTKDGLVTQAAFWFPEVSEPTRRAGLGASGREVLVTATIDGKVALRTILLEDGPIRNTAVVRGEQRLARYLRTLVAPPLPRLGTRLDVQIPPGPPKPVLKPGGRIVRETPASNRLDPTEIELPVQGNGDLPIFDQRALAERVLSGRLRFASDFIPFDQSIWSAEEMRSCPHLVAVHNHTSVTDRSVSQMADRVVRNIERYFAGETPDNAIDEAWIQRTT